ncbi:unnamed protein product [Ectocarpus sp. CCAP 1310/34]|nr:unnamed protein product [Ectocarpus sp. CCAP 1310/34]
MARCRLASSLPLCQEAMNLSAPCSTPACHGTPPSTFAASLQTNFGTPKTLGLSVVEPYLASNIFMSSFRHVSQFCSGFPWPGSSPPTNSPNISRFGSRPSGCLATAPAKSRRR